MMRAPSGSTSLPLGAASPEKSMTWRSGAPGRAASSANFRLLDRQASAGRPTPFSRVEVPQWINSFSAAPGWMCTATPWSPPSGARGPAVAGPTKTLTFATTTAELTALGDWLVAERVELVGMESTGVYW